MVRAAWPRNYHDTVRKWLAQHPIRNKKPNCAGNVEDHDDLGSEASDEEPARELAMHSATITDTARRQSPDYDCLSHGVFYATLHGPGSWCTHHCFPGRAVLLELTDRHGHDLSHELPAAVVLDENEDDDEFLQIRTNGHLAYPLTLRIVPA